MGEQPAREQTLEARIVKVAGYATAMVDQYLTARQKLAILEGLIADDVAKLFENSYGAHAYQSLRLTLILDLIRDAWAFAIDADEPPAWRRSGS